MSMDVARGEILQVLEKVYSTVTNNNLLIQKISLVGPIHSSSVSWNKADNVLPLCT